MEKLQNIYPADPNERGLALALSLCRRELTGCGGWRVHGGGFGGTVQAFVPLEILEHFKKQTEVVLGEDSCHVVTIRPAGGVRLG